MGPDADDQAAKEAFKAKLRSLNWGRVPGGSRDSKFVYRPKPSSSWEAGIVTDKRPGGYEMPLLDGTDDYKPIRMKQYAERRHEIDAQRDRLRNDPNVTRPKE